MKYIEILGYAAAICTTAAFVPQVVKTWKTKSAKDLSLGMFLVFFFGVCLWLVYGWILNVWPMIIANIVTLMLAGSLLYFKFTYKD